MPHLMQSIIDPLFSSFLFITLKLECFMINGSSLQLDSYLAGKVKYVLLIQSGFSGRGLLCCCQKSGMNVTRLTFVIRPTRRRPRPPLASIDRHIVHMAGPASPHVRINIPQWILSVPNYHLYREFRCAPQNSERDTSSFFSLCSCQT